MLCFVQNIAKNTVSLSDHLNEESTMLLSSPCHRCRIHIYNHSEVLLRWCLDQELLLPKCQNRIHAKKLDTKKYRVWRAVHTKHHDANHGELRGWSPCALCSLLTMPPPTTRRPSGRIPDIHNILLTRPHVLWRTADFKRTNSNQTGTVK